MEASLAVIGFTILIIIISIFAYTQLSASKSPSKSSSKSSKKEEQVINEQVDKEEYFTSVEDERISEGKTVKVTSSASVLEEAWIEAELGPNDDKTMYLGCIGKITEVEEDDDTVQLRWANYDTCWIPIKACIDAKGAEETLPSKMLTHLNQ